MNAANIVDYIVLTLVHFPTGKSEFSDKIFCPPLVTLIGAYEMFIINYYIQIYLLTLQSS